MRCFDKIILNVIELLFYYRPLLTKLTLIYSHTEYGVVSSVSARSLKLSNVVSGS